MIGRFPFQKLAKYPHMKRKDSAVWERFVANNPKFFDTVDYDVAMGEGAPQNPEHPANIQADGKILTQKKVDVVAYRDDMVWIIEVKPIANMRALGQILVYGALWEADHPEELPPQRMVVCGAIERELEGIYFDHRIDLEVA